MPDPLGRFADPATIAVRTRARDLRGLFRRPRPLPPGVFGRTGRGAIVLPGREPPRDGVLVLLRDRAFGLRFAMGGLADGVDVRGELELQVPHRGAEAFVRRMLRGRDRVSTLDVLERASTTLRETCAGLLDHGPERRPGPRVVRALRRGLAPVLFDLGVELVGVRAFVVLHRPPPPDVLPAPPTVAPPTADELIRQGVIRAVDGSRRAEARLRRRLREAEDVAGAVETAERDGLAAVDWPRCVRATREGPEVGRALARYPSSQLRAMTPGQLRRVADRAEDRSITRSSRRRAVVVAGRSLYVFGLDGLLMNSPDEVLRVEWDGRTGAPFEGFRCNGLRSFGRGEASVLLGHRDGVFVVDGATGRPRTHLSVGPKRFDPASRTGFNSVVEKDGRVFALHSTYGMLSWSAGGGRAREVPRASRGRALQAWTDGRLLYAAGRRPVLHDPDSELLRLAPAGASIAALAPAEDGRVFGGDARGDVLAWDPDRPERPPEVLRHGGPVTGVAVCQAEGGPALAVAAKDGLVVLDLTGRRPPLCLEGVAGTLRFVAAGGPYVLSSCHADVYLWRTDRPHRPVEVLRDHPDADGRPHRVKQLALVPEELTA